MFFYRVNEIPTGTYKILISSSGRTIKIFYFRLLSKENGVFQVKFDRIKAKQLDISIDLIYKEPFKAYMQIYPKSLGLICSF
jgi:hypothetical protein